MTTALWIWSGYHAIAIIGNLFSKERRSASVALTLISWMTWGAMLWSGHDGWFLWTNVPIIGAILLAGFAHLGKPPSSETEERAANLMWASTLRLFAVLTCWALA